MPPARVDALDVDAGRKLACNVPHAGLCLLQIGRQADHRSSRRKGLRHAALRGAFAFCSSGKLESLKSAHPLPVGHRGVERRQLDAGVVEVVLDDAVAERLAGHRRSLEELGSLGQRFVGSRSAPLIYALPRARLGSSSALSMPYQPPGDQCRDGQVLVDVAAGRATLHPHRMPCPTTRSAQVGCQPPGDRRRREAPSTKRL